MEPEPVQPVSPATLEAAATISRSLTDALRAYIRAERWAEADALKVELIRIAKSTSWLLREDRSSYDKDAPRTRLKAKA